MISVKQEWEEYKRACYPNMKLHPTQEVQVSLAFYSGILNIMHKITQEVGDPTMSEEDGEIVLKTIHEECVDELEKIAERNKLLIKQEVDNGSKKYDG